MRLGLDFAKEALLYIAMVIAAAGAVALEAKEYVAGIVLMVISAVMVIIRAVLKKKGYNVK